MNKKNKKSYPIAIKIREEQNYFIAELKNDNFRILNSNEILVAITDTLELNVDELIRIADLMLEKNQDVTKNQLTYSLLYSIASTSKTKQKRSIANKLLKEVGKEISIFSNISKFTSTFFMRHQKEIEKMMIYIVQGIIDNVLRKRKEESSEVA
uniref:hypothetical protein n=1 Tax=Arthrobacter sp. TaxID=1667 RepID=UPI0015EE6517|nr:hypothetical protein [Arthrobacter sp.]